VLRVAPGAMSTVQESDLEGGWVKKKSHDFHPAKPTAKNVNQKNNFKIDFTQLSPLLIMILTYFFAAKNNSINLAATKESEFSE
jgi:hypothetical protein